MGIKDKIKSLFISTKIDSIDNVTYSDLNSTDEHNFLCQDIIVFTEDIKIITESDYYEVCLDKNILPQRKLRATTFQTWCCGDGKLFNNLTDVINELLVESNKLEKEYRKLLTMKNSGTMISFNIRKIKPYIINIDNVKKLLNIN